MTGSRLVRGMLVLVAASGVFVATPAAADEKEAPSAVAVEGKPSLPLGEYDLGKLGYEVTEFFISGTATSYKLKG